MKRSGGLAAVAVLALVFALIDTGDVDAQRRRGTKNYDSGARYEGEFLNGKRHGEGTYYYVSGNRYSGDWRNGKRTGRGAFTWPDGHRYVGDFRNGERTGQGIYTWPDGARYEGEFRDGKRTGQGTLTWPNGDRFEGEWRNGKMHGRGTYTYADGSRQAGEWRNGKPVQNQPTRLTQRQRGGQEGEQQRRADRTSSRERPFPPGIPHLLCVADHSDLNGFGYSFEFTDWTTDEKGRPVGIFRYGTASDVYTKSEDEWTWEWSEKRVLASCYVCSENGTFTSYIFDSSSAVAGCCTYLCRHFDRLATAAKAQDPRRVPNR